MVRFTVLGTKQYCSGKLRQLAFFLSHVCSWNSLCGFPRLQLLLIVVPHLHSQRHTAQLPIIWSCFISSRCLLILTPFGFVLGRRYGSYRYLHWHNGVLGVQSAWLENLLKCPFPRVVWCRCEVLEMRWQKECVERRL